MSNKNPKERLDVLKMFVENGQNVNAIGYKGQSILIRCVGYKLKDCVEYLLKNTVIDLDVKMAEDCNFRDDVSAKAGERAIDIARRENMKDIIALLEKVTSNS